MIVQVWSGNRNGLLGNYEIELNDEDNARKAAFRYINKRREKDWQELMECTSVLKIQKLDVQTANVMLTHIH